MSTLERKAHTIRAAIADNYAAAETPPKMAQRRAALFLRTREASSPRIESREARETVVRPQEEPRTIPATPQVKSSPVSLPARPKRTSIHAPSLKRRSAVRKAEIAALEELEAQFITTAAGTRFFRVSPSREAAILAEVTGSEPLVEEQLIDEHPSEEPIAEEQLSEVTEAEETSSTQETSPKETVTEPAEEIAQETPQETLQETAQDTVQEAPEEDATASSQEATTRTPEEKDADEVPTISVEDVINNFRRLSFIGWGLIAAVVLFIAYVAVAATHTNVVAKGTTVAGVNIGSLTPKQASVKLTSELGDKTSTKIALTLPDSSEEIFIDPQSYDLTFDVDATVDSVSGFSLAPSSVMSYIFGGSEHDPVVHYDEVKLAEQLQDIQSRVKGGYVNAGIAFENLEPTVIPARDGLGISREETTEALTVGAFSADKPIALTLSQMAAPVGDDAARKAVEKYAKPLVKAPFTIEFNGKDYEASPQDLANSASFVPLKDELVLVLDGKALADIVEREKPEGVVFGQDAQIKIVNHDHVEIVPSTDGVGIEREKLADDIASSLNSSERHVVAELGVAPARFTTQDAENMGITEIVSEIDTPYHSDYYRTLNLKRGAELTSGKIIMPGETFVLSEALSPVEASNGFYPAGMIINGQHKDGMGGGLSQITTNTFNLGYLAGYTDVEHHPHSYYFTRYPMGREATLAIGSFDMRWTNNTPYGAMIDTWVEGGYVHSRLWSTKYWDVEATISAPRNISGAGWNTSTAPDCVPSYPGQNGFTVTISRTVRHGEEEWTETADVRYQPDHGMRCVEPEPEPEADSGADPGTDSGGSSGSGGSGSSGGSGNAHPQSSD